MRLISQLIRSLLTLLLIAIFGMGGAGAAPGDWTQVSYPVVAQEVSVQPVSLTNTARAPPTASANVMATGAAPMQNGSMRALAGVESPKAAYALLRPSIAPNRTFDLSKVDPPEGKTFEGTIYRYESPDRVDTTFTVHPGNVAANHRYSGPSEGAVYGGTSGDTALAEVQHYGVDSGRVLAQQDVQLNNVLDLTDPSVRSQIGVSVGDISGDSYQYTQQIGTWARQQGYDGILAPSARNPSGSNIVVLQP